MFEMISKKINNRKGFTLVELIVVIAIVAILAAIAVPRMIGFQDKAKATADKQVMAQVKNSTALLFANEDLTFTTGGAAATFTVEDGTTANTTKVTVTTAGGLQQNAAAIKAELDKLITDFDLQGTKIIEITLAPDGRVTSKLITPPVAG